jgi:hypothetical protein
MPAAFTDHMAVTIRLSIQSQGTRHSNSYWNMNTLILRETVFLQKLKKEWEQWKSHEKYHPNRVQWWDRYVKHGIRIIFQREGAERRRDHINTEHIYYTAMYQAMKAQTTNEKKAKSF